MVRKKIFIFSLFFRLQEKVLKAEKEEKQLPVNPRKTHSQDQQEQVYK